MASYRIEKYQEARKFQQSGNRQQHAPIEMVKTNRPNATGPPTSRVARQSSRAWPVERSRLSSLGME